MSSFFLIFLFFVFSRPSYCKCRLIRTIKNKPDFWKAFWLAGRKKRRAESFDCFQILLCINFYNIYPLYFSDKICYLKMIRNKIYRHLDLLKPDLYICPKIDSYSSKNSFLKRSKSTILYLFTKHVTIQKHYFPAVTKAIFEDL